MILLRLHVANSPTWTYLDPLTAITLMTVTLGTKSQKYKLERAPWTEHESLAELESSVFEGQSKIIPLIQDPTQ